MGTVSLVSTGKNIFPCRLASRVRIPGLLFISSEKWQQKFRKNKLCANVSYFLYWKSQLCLHLFPAWKNKEYNQEGRHWGSIGGGQPLGGTEALVGDISAQLRKAYPQSSAFVTVLSCTKATLAGQPLTVAPSSFSRGWYQSKEVRLHSVSFQILPHPIPCQSISIFIYRNVCFP